MKFFLFTVLLAITLLFSANEADEYEGFLSTTKWGFNLGPSYHLQDSSKDAIKISFQQKFFFTAQTSFSYNLDWFAASHARSAFGGNIIYDIVAFHYKRFTPNIGLGIGFNYNQPTSNSQALQAINFIPYLTTNFGLLFQISQNTTFQIQIPYYFSLNRNNFKNIDSFKQNKNQRIGFSLGILFSSSYTHIRKWIP